MIKFLFLFISLSAVTHSKTTTLFNKEGFEAILIVGQQEDGTKDAIARMDKIADFFKKKKVKVHQFYDGDANWNEIVQVSKNCSFLVYSGHGSNLGVDGNAGGLCLNDQISSKELMEQLRLKENALVLFQSVCKGAGSSAGDTKDIGIEEAKNRVTHYAYPFFEVGASAYYANNYLDGVLDFLTDFFDGNTLGSIYNKSIGSRHKIELEEPFEKDPRKTISIMSTPGGGVATVTTYTNGVKSVKKIIEPKSYDMAYVGASDFSIKHMK